MSDVTDVYNGDITKVKTIELLSDIRMHIKSYMSDVTSMTDPILIYEAFSFMAMNTQPNNKVLISNLIFKLGQYNNVYQLKEFKVLHRSIDQMYCEMNKYILHMATNWDNKDSNDDKKYLDVIFTPTLNRFKKTIKHDIRELIILVINFKK